MTLDTLLENVETVLDPMQLSHTSQLRIELVILADKSEVPEWSKARCFSGIHNFAGSRSSCGSSSPA